MKVLVVGGSGMIGGHAALHLQSEGHQVTIGSRHRPDSVPKLASLPFLKVDYLKQDLTEKDLSPFDAIVFAAGADPRLLPPGEDPDKYYTQANEIAVPRFATLARSAGVKYFVNIGSVYPHILPHLVSSDPYARSRKISAERIAELSAGSFKATSLDPPFVVGTVPGLIVPMFQAYVQYAEGKLPIPPFAPRGGINFISTRSLSQAISGALNNPDKVAKRVIRLGDENLTYAQYFDKFFQAAGHKEGTVQASDEEHPLLPSAFLFAGSEVIRYEMDSKDREILGNFERNDITRAIKEIVAQYSSTK